MHYGADPCHAAQPYNMGRLPRSGEGPTRPDCREGTRVGARFRAWGGADGQSGEALFPLSYDGGMDDTAGA